MMPKTQSRFVDFNRKGQDASTCYQVGSNHYYICSRNRPTTDKNSVYSFL